MSHTSSYTPAQQHVLETLRSGGSLHGERSATGSYTNITLKGQYIWPGEDVHPATVSSLLRRKEILMSGESPLGTVYFRLVEPWDRIGWIIDNMEEKLHGQHVDSAAQVAALALTDIFEELVLALPERMQKPVRAQVRRFLDLSKGKYQEYDKTEIEE